MSQYPAFIRPSEKQESITCIIPTCPMREWGRNVPMRSAPSPLRRTRRLHYKGNAMPRSGEDTFGRAAGLFGVAHD